MHESNWLSAEAPTQTILGILGCSPRRGGVRDNSSSYSSFFSEVLSLCVLQWKDCWNVLLFAVKHIDVFIDQKIIIVW